MARAARKVIASGTPARQGGPRKTTASGAPARQGGPRKPRQAVHKSGRVGQEKPRQVVHRPGRVGQETTASGAPARQGWPGNQNLKRLKSSGQCLASTLQEGTISIAGHYKRSIFYNITASLIAQLSSEVILDKDNYKTQIQNDPSSPANVKYGSLGIGTSGKTWYGTPDARCRSSISMVDIIGPENEKVLGILLLLRVKYNTNVRCT